MKLANPTKVQKLVTAKPITKKGKQDADSKPKNPPKEEQKVAAKKDEFDPFKILHTDGDYSPLKKRESEQLLTLDFELDDKKKFVDKKLKLNENKFLNTKQAQHIPEEKNDKELKKEILGALNTPVNDKNSKYTRETKTSEKKSNVATIGMTPGKLDKQTISHIEKDMTTKGNPIKNTEKAEKNLESAPRASTSNILSSKTPDLTMGKKQKFSDNLISKYKHKEIKRKTKFDKNSHPEILNNEEHSEIETERDDEVDIEPNPSPSRYGRKDSMQKEIELFKNGKLGAIEEYPTEPEKPEKKQECTYGERLFRKGLALRDFEVQKIEENRQKQVEKEVSTLMSKPKISKKSQRICTSSAFDFTLTSNNKDPLPKKHYMLDIQSSRIKLQGKHKDTMGIEGEFGLKNIVEIGMGNDNFGGGMKDPGVGKIEPRVSRNSDPKGIFLSEDTGTIKSNNGKRRLTTEESLFLSTRLYEEAKLRSEKKEKESEEFIEKSFPFTPSINNKDPPKHENFYYRMLSWLEQKQEKSLRILDESSLDYRTGQRLFSPRLVASTINKNDESQQINEPGKKFNDLYEAHRDKLKKRQTLQDENLRTLRIQANNRKISQNSEKISHEIKNSVFKKIFEMLDKHGEGRVSGEQLDLSSLPTNLRKILEPLVKELKEQNESLSCDEFLIACDHMYEELPASNKNIIYDFYFENRKYQNANKKTEIVKPKRGSYIVPSPKKRLSIEEKSALSPKSAMRKRSSQENIITSNLLISSGSLNHSNKDEKEEKQVSKAEGENENEKDETNEALKQDFNVDDEKNNILPEKELPDNGKHEEIKETAVEQTEQQEPVVENTDSKQEKTEEIVSPSQEVKTENDGETNNEEKGPPAEAETPAA